MKENKPRAVINPYGMPANYESFAAQMARGREVNSNRPKWQRQLRAHKGATTRRKNRERLDAA